MNCPAVNYLTTATRIALQGRALSASVQIEVTGAPVFQFALEPENVCGGPATMRLFLERANEPTANTADFYRWWSDVTLPLTPGGGSLTVPVTPDRWGSVFGTKGNASPAAVAGFEATLADLATVGMTFGGGCFAGHGVNISGGTARFILTSFLAQ